MREIKFRGKRIDTGEWVEGYLWGHIHRGRKCLMIGTVTRSSSIDGFEVIPETVGQFTGLQDKNGVDIYEGDIIFCDNWNPNRWNIEWVNNGWHFTNPELEYYPNKIHFIEDSTGVHFEIIGNIHDNPEEL